MDGYPCSVGQEKKQLSISIDRNFIYTIHIMEKLTKYNLQIHSIPCQIFMYILCV